MHLWLLIGLSASEPIEIPEATTVVQPERRVDEAREVPSLEPEPEPVPIAEPEPVIFGELQVRGPAGAELVIDGREQGSLPLGTIHLPVGKHSVALVKNGYTPYRAQVEVVADQPARIDAGPMMRLSNQRRVGFGLLGAAVSGLAAAGTLGALARRDDRRAASLLPEGGGLPGPDQEARYEDLSASADQFRRWAIVSGIVGTSALFSSAVLLAFDKPNLDARRPQPPRVGPMSVQTPSLRLRWRPAVGGATLHARF